MIAIDFEYCSNQMIVKDWGLDYLHRNKPWALKLFCVSICINKVEKKSWWLQKREERDDFIRFMNEHNNDWFISHAYELAEAICLEQLGIDTEKLNMVDTFTLAKIWNTRYMAGWECSLKDVCKLFLGIDIDAIEKEEMRRHCINDTTEGHEAELMNYCEHDVQHLEKIVDVIKQSYNEYMTRARYVDIHKAKKISFEEYLAKLSEDLQLSQWIRHNGIPVNKTVLDALKNGAKQFMDKYMEDMNERFKVSIFTTDKYGNKHKVESAIQSLLADDLKSRNITRFPKTPKGNLCTSKEVLKEIFDTRDDPRDSLESSFGEWLCYYTNQLGSSFNGLLIEPTSSSNTKYPWHWNYYNGKIYVPGVGPNMAKTQRWQAKPKNGYIPQWSKPLRGVMNPSEGRYLVECDFKSQETALFGTLFNDKKYIEMYQSADPYLFNAAEMGLVPKGLTKDECNKEQLNIRKTIKTFSLAWQYGAGVRTLSQRAKIPEKLAKVYKEKLDSTYSNGINMQRAIVDALYKKSRLQGYNKSMLILPDGYPILTYCRDDMIKPNTLGNQPIQSFGAYILRTCLRRCKEAGLRVIAPVHDAIWIDTDKESDADRLAKIMLDTAHELMHSDILRIDTMIIKHDEFRLEEPAYYNRFKEICEFGGLKLTDIDKCTGKIAQ